MIFTVYGLLLLTAIPLTLLIPDMVRDGKRSEGRSRDNSRQSPPAAKESGGALASAP
jgi:hypothetical protein